jgi:nucleotidyltransferase substrate binding protein (TIGR01987 family)
MEQTTYYDNKLSHLRQAIASFAIVMDIDLSTKNEFDRDIYKNAAVQKFEYSTELYWKVAKLYLFQNKGIDESSPKGVLKALFQESSLSLEAYEMLLKIINHRNLLSHLYDPAQFEEIYSNLKKYASTFVGALKAFTD